MEIASNFLLPGLLGLLILVLGFWLSGMGKPYPGLLFNLHKLSALGGVIYTGWFLAQFLGSVNLPVLLIVFLAIASLAVLALFVSGGFLSAGKLDYAFLLAIHRIGSILLAGALGAVVYLLYRG